MIQINYGNIPGALCLLFMCSLLYDRLVVEPVETHSPALGVTAWEVAGGVLYTMVIAAFVIGFDMAMLILLFFVASGIPMIMGSYARHTARAG